MKVFDKNLNMIVDHVVVTYPASILDGVSMTKSFAENMLAIQLEHENYEACICLQNHIDKFDENGIVKPLSRRSTRNTNA